MKFLVTALKNVATQCTSDANSYRGSSVALLLVPREPCRFPAILSVGPLSAINTSPRTPRASEEVKCLN